MKHPLYTLLAFLLLLPLALHAAVPLRWTVETSRLQPVVFDVVRGETLAFEADFKSYGKPLEMTNRPCALFYQTNAMASSWWTLPARATELDPSVVTATFAPTNDPGASVVHGFLGSTGDIYRAAFTLRFRHGPGAAPNVIDAPPRILDLAHTVVINPPWPTQADYAATTTVMRAELKDYVDEQIEGAGVVSPQVVTNIVDAKIAAIHKDGVSTNAVSSIITNHVTSGYIATTTAVAASSTSGTNYTDACCRSLAVSATNYTDACCRALAVASTNYTDAATNAIPRITDGQNEITATGDTYIESPLGEWTPSHSPIPENPKVGSFYYDNIVYENEINCWLCNYNLCTYDDPIVSWDTSTSILSSFERENSTLLYFPDGTPTRRLLRTRLATTNDVSSSSAQTLASALSSLSAATNGLATAATVSTLSTQVSAIGAHLNAEDARFVSTNYDSVVHLPEAYVEIKMDGTWITIWKEMRRWSKFVGDTFSWDSWGGFHAFMTNVTSELSFKADRCWGIYDSETGGYSPNGYTQISSSNILIAANMAYQLTLTSGGAVWILQCNSGTAHIGGETNAFLRIQDGDGVTQFEIVKGNKEELGADADGISVNNATTPPTVTIPYSVVAEEHPTLQICDNLATAHWKSETDADCLATVSWSGSSGAYVATVRRKSPGDALFVKATYMSGCETYIRNVAPVGMDSIVLNGTKYYLGTNVVSGVTVLTLSTTPPNQ